MNRLRICDCGMRIEFLPNDFLREQRWWCLEYEIGTEQIAQDIPGNSDISTTLFEGFGLIFQ
jgi:hypothetical protein